MDSSTTFQVREKEKQPHQRTRARPSLSPMSRKLTQLLFFFFSKITSMVACIWNLHYRHCGPGHDFREAIGRVRVHGMGQQYGMVVWILRLHAGSPPKSIYPLGLRFSRAHVGRDPECSTWWSHGHHHGHHRRQCRRMGLLGRHDLLYH